MTSVRRLRSKTTINGKHYLRCSVKTITFLFWAFVYVLVIKATIFKSNINTTVKDWSVETDNYTKWLLKEPVASDEDELQNTDIYLLNKLNETAAELEIRSERVKHVCRERSVSRSQMINSKEFFLDYDHNLVWCNIFKAASSSWLYNFNILGGYETKFLARTRHTPLTLARRKFPRPSQEELRDAITTPGVLSLLIVREPFVRLLSAYRDKLENITPPYYRKLARAIVQKHRGNATRVLGNIKSSAPTFYEFVAYLISKHTNHNQASAIDEHWAPYYEFCSPCSVNFTVIAKVETLSRDSAFVINQLGLSHVLGPRIRNRKTRLRTVMNKSKDGKNTTALIKHYFKQIDEKMLKKLLDIYGLDFDMFGYDPKVYFKYVRI